MIEKKLDLWQEISSTNASATYLMDLGYSGVIRTDLWSNLGDGYTLATSSVKINIEELNCLRELLRARKEKK